MYACTFEKRSWKQSCIFEARHEKFIWANSHFIYSADALEPRQLAKSQLKRKKGNSYISFLRGRELEHGDRKSLTFVTLERRPQR